MLRLDRRGDESSVSKGSRLRAGRVEKWRLRKRLVFARCASMNRSFGVMLFEAVFAESNTLYMMDMLR